MQLLRKVLQVDLKLTKIVDKNFLNNRIKTQDFTWSGNILIKTEEIKSSGDFNKIEFNYVNNKLESLIIYGISVYR